jgi:hypothetical protein
MKFTTPIEISGIRRIVINRLIIWETRGTCDEGITVWDKIAGGPGFDYNKAAGSRRAMKTPEQMKLYIDYLLEKQVVTGHWQGHEVVAEQYRAWVHGDTLNIVEIKRGKKCLMVKREVR